MQVKIFQFKNFKLGKNEIVNIKPFEKCPFSKLEKLDLFDNKIQDIEPLKNIPIKDIQELDLSFNQIKSIDPLLNVKFKKMKDLKIEGNENLDYSNKNKNIQKIYEDYGINYTFNSIL